MKKTILVLLTILLAFSCVSVMASADEANPQSIEDINGKLNGMFHIEGLSVTSITVVAGEESHMVIYGTISNDDKSTPWSREYSLTEEQYLALYHANDSVLVYEKGKTDISADTAKLIGQAVDASVTDLGVAIDFKPAEFTRNLKYMGLGMLGIFIVVGVVIVLTYVLNKATSKKELM